VINSEKHQGHSKLFTVNGLNLKLTLLITTVSRKKELEKWGFKKEIQNRS
jgi:hypothetical protein